MLIKYGTSTIFQFTHFELMACWCNDCGNCELYVEISGGGFDEYFDNIPADEWQEVHTIGFFNLGVIERNAEGFKRLHEIENGITTELLKNGYIDLNAFDNFEIC